MKNYTSSLYVLGKQITYSDNESKQLIKDAKQVTHEQLKQIRDKSTLIPGQWYRITDYVCTTVQEGTQSAGHPFDILVRADAVDKLNETAYATLHKGDTYFANSKLEAWELKYTIDNDTTRFAWADLENGKGVIYYMKDEWNNECPYDFKNILYVFEEGFEYNKWGITVIINRNSSLDTEVEGTMYYGYTVKGNLKPPSWLSFNCYIKNYPLLNLSEPLYETPGGSTLTAGTITRINSKAFNTYTFDINDSDATLTEKEGYVYDNSISPYYYHTTNGPYAKKYFILNNIHFKKTGYIFNCYNNRFESGCYNNIFENDCSKNIFGSNCHNNTFGKNCSSNTFGNNCSSNMFGNNCNSNTFGNDCNSNTFGYDCQYNTFGNDCHNNTFEDSSKHNTFGNDCHNNTFGGSYLSLTTSYNTFGNSCSNNTFGTGAYINIFGNYCLNNSFGNAFSRNTFGVDCNNNTFGKECLGNIFGGKILYNTFGNYCSYNTFEYGSHHNTFGDYFASTTIRNSLSSSIFGDYCHNNTFGNNCSNIVFGTSANSLKSYYRNIIIENGNQYINLNRTDSSSNYCQNILISLGVNNTSTAKTINIDTVNQHYKTVVCTDSLGQLVTYVPGDAHHAQPVAD